MTLQSVNTNRRCRYVQEVRESVEPASGLAPREAFFERSRKIGEMWRSLPVEEKEVNLTGYLMT